MFLEGVQCFCWGDAIFNYARRQHSYCTVKPNTEKNN